MGDPRPIFFSDTKGLLNILNVALTDGSPIDLAAITGLPVWRDLLHAALPTDLGGLSLARDPSTVDALFDILSHVGATDLSAARLLEGHVNAVRLVLVHGSDPAVREMSHAVAEGGLLGVWGANGADPLTAKAVPEGVALSGGKRFASGLGHVTHAVLTARDAAGERMIFAPVNDAARQDPAAWTASAMRATVSGGFDAGGMVLPAQAVMGAPGDLKIEPHFEGGIWRYCAAHVGGAEGLIRAWALLLRRMGRDGDAIQRSRLGRALAAAASARATVRAAAHTVEGSVGTPDAEIRAAVAQVLLAREATASACIEILALCEASLGMAAHDAAGPIDGRRRDLSLFIRQAAPDDKLDRAVAHYLETLA